MIYVRIKSIALQTQNQWPRSSHNQQIWQEVVTFVIDKQRPIHPNIKVPAQNFYGRLDFRQQSHCLCKQSWADQPKCKQKI